MKSWCKGILVFVVSLALCITYGCESSRVSNLSGNSSISHSSGEYVLDFSSNIKEGTEKPASYQVYEKQTALSSFVQVKQKPEQTKLQKELKEFIWYAPTCNLISRQEMTEEDKINFLFDFSYWVAKNQMHSSSSLNMREFLPAPADEPDSYYASSSQLQKMLIDYIGYTLDESVMENSGLIDAKGRRILSFSDTPHVWAVDDLPVIKNNGEFISGKESYLGMDIIAPVYRGGRGMGSDIQINAWVYKNAKSAFGYTLQTFEVKPLLENISPYNYSQLQTSVSADIKNMIDSEGGTVWGCEGDGNGVSIQFDFAQRIWLDNLSIQPGDTRSVSSFLKGRKITFIRLEFDDGQHFDLAVPDFLSALESADIDIDADQPIPPSIMVSVPFPHPVESQSVTLTILETDPQSDNRPVQTMIGGIDFFAKVRPKI